jgi:hypothetical protein
LCWVEKWLLFGVDEGSSIAGIVIHGHQSVIHGQVQKIIIDHPGGVPGVTSSIGCGKLVIHLWESGDRDLFVIRFFKDTVHVRSPVHLLAHNRGIGSIIFFLVNAEIITLTMVVSHFIRKNFSVDLRHSALTQIYWFV